MLKPICSLSNKNIEKDEEVYIVPIVSSGVIRKTQFSEFAPNLFTDMKFVQPFGVFKSTYLGNHNFGSVSNSKIFENVYGVNAEKYVEIVTKKFAHGLVEVFNKKFYKELVEKEFYNRKINPTSFDSYSSLLLMAFCELQISMTSGRNTILGNYRDNQESYTMSIVPLNDCGLQFINIKFSSYNHNNFSFSIQINEDSTVKSIIEEMYSYLIKYEFYSSAFIVDNKQFMEFAKSSSYMLIKKDVYENIENVLNEVDENILTSIHNKIDIFGSNLSQLKFNFPNISADYQDYFEKTKDSSVLNGFLYTHQKIDAIFKLANISYEPIKFSENNDYLNIRSLLQK